MEMSRAYLVNGQATAVRSELPVWARRPLLAWRGEKANAGVEFAFKMERDVTCIWQQSTGPV